MREITRFFVALPRVFPLSVRARRQTFSSTNSSASVYDSDWDEPKIGLYLKRPYKCLTAENTFTMMSYIAKPTCSSYFIVEKMGSAVAAGECLRSTWPRGEVAVAAWRAHFLICSLVFSKLSNKSGAAARRRGGRCSLFVVALSRNSIKRDETKRRERDRSTSSCHRRRVLPPPPLSPGPTTTEGRGALLSEQPPMQLALSDLPPS